MSFHSTVLLNYFIHSTLWLPECQEAPYLGNIKKVSKIHTKILAKNPWKTEITLFL